MQSVEHLETTGGTPTSYILEIRSVGAADSTELQTGTI